MIEAGKLNKRVTFQRNTPTANAINELVDTYADYVTVWGQVRPLVGTRRYQAKQLNADVAGQVIIRYRRDILPTMRMVVEGKYLYIISIVDPDNAHISLEIEYKEALD